MMAWNEQEIYSTIYALYDKLSRSVCVLAILYRQPLDFSSI